MRERLAWLSTVASIDLLAHGTVSDAETIRDTAVAQPLIVAAGLSCLPLVCESPGQVAGALAGHSVGEITAAAVAGALSSEQAMVLVRERGAAMAQAATLKPTGMSAVLGGDPLEVEASLAAKGLTGANMNGSGQVVAAGTLEQLAALAADPPAKARVVPLKVAGAFHTQHMAPAVTRLKEVAAAVEPRTPVTRLLSNADGAVVGDGQEVLRRLVNQVCNPVRWDRCQETLQALGVTGLLELPPAGALTNMAKRSLPDIERVALKTPDDLPAARDLVARHATQAPVEIGARAVVGSARGPR
ncbi:MAG: [acyl-carrier-protein] S-malonyltransferase [Actinomycetota bacterium]|nr:[acyl-carrier-protein] S-malonyltransferase [Actinomycetota bacterium]